jgi:hypothetical protein
MRTLDLHGVPHKEVEDKLSEFFFWHGVENAQAKIITGNSDHMQRLVLEWLDECEFKYYIPASNLGEIQVVE